MARATLATNSASEIQNNEMLKHLSGCLEPIRCVLTSAGCSLRSTTSGYSHPTCLLRAMARWDSDMGSKAHPCHEFHDVSTPPAA